MKSILTIFILVSILASGISQNGEIYLFSITDDSENYLGGVPPPEFSIPSFEFNAPFQYLGKLSKGDEAFDWLPFDLHLVAPIYLDIEKIYLDYSDPNHPKVINIEELKITGTAYDGLKPDSEVIFKKVPFKTEISDKILNIPGHSGVPFWVQQDDIPICPITNQAMEFVCQLESNTGVMTEWTNVKLKNESYFQYFEEMNFWIDGSLFVFFNQKSKVVCIIIQNT